MLEGSDNRVLNLGVGRIPETSEPGEAGNVVLGGHRDTFFRPLRGIRTGDSIKLLTPQGSYNYTVDWTKVVDPENTELLKTTPQPSLTLVTCYPFHFVGPAPRRFIVRAHQETEVATSSVEQQLPPMPLQESKASGAIKRVRHPVARRTRPPLRKTAYRRPAQAPAPTRIAPPAVRPAREHSLAARVLAAARRRVRFNTH